LSVELLNITTRSFQKLEKIEISFEGIQGIQKTTMLLEIEKVTQIKSFE